ncbi:hypothetical protein KR222_011064, partial [Zaprionus bogoriensis]
MYSNIFLLIALGLCLGLASVQAAAVDLVVEKVPEVDLPVDGNAVPEQCHQPKETGRCFALFYRFAYNLDTNACEQFIYGGCAGNSNNFETLEQCEQLCLGKASATESTATELTTELTTEQQQSD